MRPRSGRRWSRSTSGSKGPRQATARDLRILKDIAEALNGAADVDRALRESLSLVVKLLGMRTGWVWLIDPHTGRFYSATAQNLPPFLGDPVRMTGRSCWCIDAFRSGKLTAGNIDVIECSRLRAALGKRTATRGLRYHASIPLSFGGRPLGIMNVATAAWRKLTRRELDLLSTIASQVGAAIERARLAEANVGAARMEERAKLARDLHDTLTQGLTAIGLHVEAAMSHMRERPVDSAAKELERALEIARSNLDEARRSLSDLRSSPLEGKPLAEALGALGRQLTADTGVRVTLHITTKVPIPPHVETAFFRIASEALTNVRRHAEARDVTITLSSSRHTTRLTIADDGKGFSMNRRDTTETYGIQGMRERARLLGGTLMVRAKPNRGTQVSIAINTRQATPSRRHSPLVSRQ
jgi:two-component system NarL family sensor kinase